MAPPAGSGSTTRRTQFVDLDDNDDDDFKDLPPLYHVVAPGSVADRLSRPVAAAKPAPAPKPNVPAALRPKEVVTAPILRGQARWKARAATDLTMVATVPKENDDSAGKTASSSPLVVFQRNPRPGLVRTKSDTSAAFAPPVSVPDLPSSSAPAAPIVRPVAESHRLEAERRADRRRKRDDADDLATVDDDLQLALAISASMSSSSAATPVLELDWKTGTFKYPDPPAVRGRAAKRQAPQRSLTSTAILAVEEAKAEVQQAALTYLFDHAPPLSSSTGERNRTPSATRLASADPECRLWRAASPRPAEATSWTSSSVPPACLSISSDEDEVGDEPPRPPFSDNDAMDVIMDDQPIPRHPSPPFPPDRFAARLPSAYEQETLRRQFVDESPLLSLFDSWTQSASCTAAADVVAKRRLLESQLQDLWASTVDWLNLAELKQLAKDAGVKVTGRKEELIARIQAARSGVAVARGGPANVESRVVDYLAGDQAIYTKILTYEPLDVDDLQAKLAAASIRCGRTALISLLDAQSIIHFSSSAEGRWNR
ncbi:hypothetical protein GGF32_001306 [Allomyces javanicus]|nr:hypothetical protein GGF32_001306 [Allomyces javanicus]